MAGPVESSRNYIDRFRDATDCFLHNYEIDEKVPLLHISGIMKSYRKDIFYAESTPIMDLDLMRTYKTEEYLIRHLFEQQKKEVRRAKCFMFTLSMRGVKQPEMTLFLSRLLQTTVIRTDPKSNDKGIHEYKFKAGFNTIITAYTYFDTCAMMSFLIQY